MGAGDVVVLTFKDEDNLLVQIYKKQICSDFYLIHLITNIIFKSNLKTHIYI